MSHYLRGIAVRLKNFSQTLINQSKFWDKEWKTILPGDTILSTLIFRPNNELIIIKDGITSINKWEFVTSDILTLRNGNEALSFNPEYISDDILILKIYGKDEFIGLVSSNAYINNIEQSIEKQFKKLDKQIEKSTPSLINVNVISAGGIIRQSGRYCVEITVRARPSKVRIIKPSNFNLLNSYKTEYKNTATQKKVIIYCIAPQQMGLLSINPFKILINNNEQKAHPINVRISEKAR